MTLFQLGYWSTKDGIKLGSQTAGFGAHGEKKPILRAITVVEEPYVMRKKDFESRTGNDRYEGSLNSLNC